MRNDWANDNDQTVNPFLYDGLVHGDAAVVAPTAVVISRQQHLKPSMLETLSELHGSKGAPGQFHNTICLID